MSKKSNQNPIPNPWNNENKTHNYVPQNLNSNLNPFPNPQTIDKEIDNEVREIIKNMFKNTGKLNFHDMLSYLEDSVRLKDIKRAKISAYYCCNTMLNSNKNDHEKADFISGIKNLIDNISNE